MGERPPLTPWVKKLMIVTYCLFTSVLLLGGTRDLQAFALGLGMLTYGATWAFLGTRRLNAPFERLGDLGGMVLSGIIVAALTLASLMAALYVLVRFVRWSWLND